MSRPAVWPVLVAYGAALVGSITASQTLVDLVARLRGGSDPSRAAAEATRFALSVPGLGAVATVDAIVLAGVALGTGHLLGGGVGVRLGLGRTRVGPAGMLAAVLGTAGLSLACGAAVDLLPFGRGTVMTAIASALHGTSPAGLVGAVVALGVAPGIAEEALFRGLLQIRLAERWGRWPAIAMASAAFGLMHMDLVQGTVAFAVGLFLGWIADRAGGIRPAIVAHAANNALFVLIAAFTVADTGPRATTSMALLAAGLGAWIASVALLRSSASFRRVHESAL